MWKEHHLTVFSLLLPATLGQAALLSLDNLEFSHCPVVAGQHVSVSSLSLTPYPVVFNCTVIPWPLQVKCDPPAFNLNFKVEVKDEIPANSTIEVTVARQLYPGVFLPLPCTKLPGLSSSSSLRDSPTISNCIFTFDQLFAYSNVCEQVSDATTTIAAPTTTTTTTSTTPATATLTPPACSLPLDPKTYSGSVTMNIPLVLAGFLDLHDLVSTSNTISERASKESGCVVCSSLIIHHPICCCRPDQI